MNWLLFNLSLPIIHSMQMPVVEVRKYGVWLLAKNVSTLRLLLIIINYRLILLSYGLLG